MDWKTAAAAVMLAIGLNACGPGSEVYTSGTRVAEAQVCRLKIGSSTRAQAIAALGRPDSQSTGWISYQYSELDRGTVLTNVSVLLFFDASDRLELVSWTSDGSTRIPACLDAAR